MISSGGGGGGGLVCGKISIYDNLTITIGQGGAAGSGGGGNGVNGGNTMISFSKLENNNLYRVDAVGGGGGAGTGSTSNGSNGGSGGGACRSNYGTAINSNNNKYIQYGNMGGASTYRSNYTYGGGGGGGGGGGKSMQYITGSTVKYISGGGGSGLAPPAIISNISQKYLGNLYSAGGRAGIQVLVYRELGNNGSGYGNPGSGGGGVRGTGAVAAGYNGIVIIAVPNTIEIIS
jgi:hypothetical protein